MAQENRKTAGGVDRRHARSTLQKSVFGGLHFGILLICVWLLFGGGVSQIGRLSGQAWIITNPARGILLFAAAGLYWLRHLVTLFILLMRAVDWQEVFGLLGFFALFEIGFLLIGAGVFRQTPPLFGGMDIAGLSLLFIGSFLNSGSEIQRKFWKQKPGSKGRCYTGGMFRYAMHINFFGDVVLFTGWALLTSSLWALGLPLLMAVMFIFLHIPPLDAYLADRYGQEFLDYAARTKKLIPFVY